MSTPTHDSTGALVEGVSAVVVGGGLLTMVLFPLAIPILALTAIAVIPLLLPVLAAGLIFAAVAAPILLVRRLSRRASTRARSPMTRAEPRRA